MTKLETLRKEKGMSREKLAREIGVCTSLVNVMCVRGNPRPSYETVMRLSAILGVTPDEVVELLKPDNQGGAVENAD